MKTNLEPFKKYEISATDYLGAGRKHRARWCAQLREWYFRSLVAPPYAGDPVLKANADAACAEFEN